jgi:hypothetical protein
MPHDRNSAILFRFRTVRNGYNIVKSLSFIPELPVKEVKATNLFEKVKPPPFPVIVHSLKTKRINSITKV